MEASRKEKAKIESDVHKTTVKGDGACWSVRQKPATALCGQLSKGLFRGLSERGGPGFHPRRSVCTWPRQPPIFYFSNSVPEKHPKVAVHVPYCSTGSTWIPGFVKPWVLLVLSPRFYASFVKVVLSHHSSRLARR